MMNFPYVDKRQTCILGGPNGAYIFRSYYTCLDWLWDKMLADSPDGLKLVAK